MWHKSNNWKLEMLEQTYCKIADRLHFVTVKHVVKHGSNTWTHMDEENFIFFHMFFHVDTNGLMMMILVA